MRKFSASGIILSKIKDGASKNVERIVLHILPNGQREGSEWVSLNPTRSDQNLGSFKINLHTGKWADFATGDRGGDVISLIAYIQNLSQIEAAIKIKDEYLGG